MIIFKGNARSVKAKKNILASFTIKGIDVLVYFLLVPLTLGYLNEYEYGIWLTLNSILMWINSFDIGLGNGLRNKLTEALALDDRELCKSYVSTTFFMLCGLMGLFVFAGSLLLPFLDWYSILGASTESVVRLNQIVYISFVLFCLNFILKFIGNVYLALQLPAINNLLVCMGHALSLIIIYILSVTTSGSLFYVALAYSAAPPLIYLIFYPFTFGARYRFMAPSIKFFKMRYLKSLFSMGVLFFIIQLGSLLLFSTANIIISHLFGPDKVTPYNIAYRYFSVIAIGMNLVITPFWSATTDAYIHGDMDWVKGVMSKMRILLFAVAVVIVLMIVVSPIAYQIWIGNKVEIPFAMTVCMGLYTFILVWSMSFSNFLNGMGKLKIQAINTMIVGILFIPIGIYIGQFLGLYGIVVSLCIVNFSGALLNSIQFYKVVNHRALGIWAK